MTPTRFALVTGAAGGIGRAVVSALSGAGYSVVGTDRVVPVHRPVDCSFIPADLQRSVEDEAYAEEVFRQVRAITGGSLSLLVNNAAVQVLGTAKSLSREDWRATVDVNVMAPFLWTQALLPDLEAARGCVVNVSSVHARLTKPGFVAYATSKAALSGMTRALAVELRGRIRINAIEPAAIATDMLKAGFADSPAKLSQLYRLHPLGRIGTPEEVGSLVVALAGDTLGFMHGASIAYDGGIGACLLDPDASMDADPV